MGIRERWKRFRPVPADVLERLPRLAPFFRERGVEVAYLFGSLAERRKGEDVDIAVLGRSLEPEVLREQIQQELGTERLDLVDLGKAKLTLQFEIIRNGKIFFKKDDDAENRFELGVLKAYQDWAPIRSRRQKVLEERTQAWLSRDT